MASLQSIRFSYLGTFGLSNHSSATQLGRFRITRILCILAGFVLLIPIDLSEFAFGWVDKSAFWV